MTEDDKKTNEECAGVPTKVGYGSPPLHSRFKKGQSGKSTAQFAGQGVYGRGS